MEEREAGYWWGEEGGGARGGTGVTDRLSTCLKGREEVRGRKMGKEEEQRGEWRKREGHIMEMAEGKGRHEAGGKGEVANEKTDRHKVQV